MMLSTSWTANRRDITNIGHVGKMSFGFGVGDFLAVIKLGNDIRRDFADAPAQFQQITAEIRNLVIALGDVDVSLAAHDVSEEQNNNLNEIRESCRRVLEDSRKELIKYYSLESEGGSLQQRTKRIWRRVKWEPDDVRDLRGRITANIVALNSFTGANIRDTVFKLEERQARQDNEKTLEWLTTLDTTAQQADSIRQRQTGTGQWFLDSPEYTKWKATKGEILFCHGIPGAGKTILSSIVVENLQDAFGIEADIAICYFYFNFKSQSEQAVEDVLLSLLKQLSHASASVPDKVQALFDRCMFERRRPNAEEIMKTLCSVAGSFSRVLIVADAIDECQTSSGCQRELISHLIELQRIAGVNIMATARPVPHIVERFKQLPFVEVRASVGDVYKYIESNLVNLPGYVSRDKKLQDEIKEGITKAADGMFLLAKLHLDSLKGKKSPRALRQTLYALASGNDAYDEAYQNTMVRINGQLSDQKELATNTLMWIVHAKRPLTTFELQDALGVEIGEQELFEDNLPDLDDLVSACCGLVTIDEGNRIIRLIHYTTQEFFDRHGTRLFPHAETRIADTCATYLAFDVFGSGPSRRYGDFGRRLTDFPLYSYSSLYWGQHADLKADSEFIRILLNRPSQVEACGHALSILQEGQKTRSAFGGEYDYAKMGTTGMTSLHLAAYFGLAGIAESILDDLQELNILDSRRRTPVWYAAQNGHQDVVRQLIDRACSSDVKDFHQQTPLQVAARNGHEAIVHMLLDEGAQVDHVDGRGRAPLSGAAENGHLGIVRLLLNNGAWVDHTDKYGRTPLYLAVENGHQSVVVFLLEQFVLIQIDSTDEDGETPLSRAAGKGLEALVRLLLDKGAQINHADKRGRVPLSGAAENGHQVIVRLLLDCGAHVDCTDNFGRTPLYWATVNDRDATVRLLLNKGAHIEQRDDDGQTPLLAAIRKGYSRLAETLLEHGAQINVGPREDELVPLILAASFGRWQIMELLLAAGADYTAMDIYGRSALMYAIILDHPKVVDVLLAQDGLDPNAKDHWGSTAISLAARFGNLAIFRQIAALPSVSILAQDGFGRTPLWWAQRQRHDNITRQIVGHPQFTNDEMIVNHPLAFGDPVRLSGRDNYCDVCLASLGSRPLHCSKCTGGDFGVCQECHGLGARCLVESHQLSALQDRIWA